MKSVRFFCWLPLLFTGLLHLHCSKPLSQNRNFIPPSTTPLLLKNHLDFTYRDLKQSPAQQSMPTHQSPSPAAKPYDGKNLAANLITSALEKELAIDIVFYPNTFVPGSNLGQLASNMSEAAIEQAILSAYPSGPKDLFRIGTLKGSDIRKFINSRSSQVYQVDLQVAGLKYELHFKGGLPSYSQIMRADGSPLLDETVYRVAISKDAFFNPFPGYRFGNGLESRLKFEQGEYSARQFLKQYLLKVKDLSHLSETRASVILEDRGEIFEPITIPQIQGQSHLSPYRGQKVRTEGIITAISKSSDGETELFLQAEHDDGDPRTSNAITVYLKKSQSDLEVGQRVRLTGLCYEVITPRGLSRTSLRNADILKIMARGIVLPEPVLIGPGGLTVPHTTLSSHVGDVNDKAELILTDGLDFWESLEAMRIRVARPIVVGFRGGKEKYDSAKRYLSLFVRPEASSPSEQITAANGLLHAPELGDFNPEIIRISTGILAPKVDAQMSFNVGDKFAEDLVGIMSFQTNSFGEGEFTLFVTGDFSSTSPIKTLEERPMTRLVGDQDHLTAATWNVENLSALDNKRMKRIGSAIKISLKCPDVINMPEIQDNNGKDSSGDTAADETLKALVTAIDCPDADYQPINIDPMPNADGGEPGGNIRVAMLYNARRVNFLPRAQAASLDETIVLPGVGLNQNPGRLFPNDPDFAATRKPLVVEFSFKDQRFFMIGIHLNSRLSDQSSWSKDQPSASVSERDRIRLATKINGFISDLIQQDPMAKILVAGDANAYWHERSMQILTGNFLQNLMTHGNLLEKNQRYSTNFDGNSSCIDHILASHAMLNQSPELEIVHMNSDFMDKISDHDPVIARFSF